MANTSLSCRTLPSRFRYRHHAGSNLYREVFGWSIRSRGDGQLAFDDGVGEVSGTWVRGSPPVNAGFVYIMVADADATCALVVRHGGVVVEPPDPDAREIVAKFRDPAGNLFGTYQDRSLRAASAAPPG